MAWDANGGNAWAVITEGGPDEQDVTSFPNTTGEHMERDHDIKFHTNAMTVGCWAYLDVFASGAYLFSTSSTGDWAFRFWDTDTWRGYYSSTQETADGSNMPISEWHQLVMRHKDDATGAIETWQDATEVCSSSCNTNTGDVGVGALQMAIGATRTGGGPVTGRIHECWVANDALTDFEICSICRFGLDGQTPDRGDAACSTCVFE
jgi:hypothetical protein